MTLEELLNKCIQRGWKPFDVDVKIKRAKCFYSVHFIVRWLVNFVLDGYAEATVPLRELCSKESGLWQFVCENGMVRKDRFTWMISPDPLCEDQYNYTDYRYRLIESALCDEDKLEQFLLDNIEVE